MGMAKFRHPWLQTPERIIDRRKFTTKLSLYGMSIIVAELWRPEVGSTVVENVCENLRLFGKNDSLRKSFQNSVAKGFIATPIDVLCSNFVKFDRQETGKVVRYLPDRVRNLPRPAPHNAPTAIQISSKSVHFRRSYTRRREHRQHGLLKCFQYLAETQLRVE